MGYEINSTLLTRYIYIYIIYIYIYAVASICSGCWYVTTAIKFARNSHCVLGTHYQSMWYLARVFLPGKQQQCRLSRLIQPAVYADILTQKVCRPKSTFFIVFGLCLLLVCTKSVWFSLFEEQTRNDLTLCFLCRS